MIARASLLMLLVTLAGCAEHNASDAAMHAFQSFQTALQQGDQTVCRELLTTESQEALANMPWYRIAEQQPLEVLRATQPLPDVPRFHVEVKDPNHDGALAEFVVVREYGRMVVDLVASAGLTATVVEASGQPEQFEPRQLTPQDHERIRQYELSQPPR